MKLLSCYFSLGLVFFLQSCSLLPPGSTVPEAPPPADASVAAPVEPAQSYEVDPLDADQLAIVLGEKLAGVKLPRCPLSHDQTIEALAQLQAMRHGAIEKLVKEMETKSDVGTQWMECRKECACGLYTDVLDLLPSEAVNQLAAKKIRTDAIRTSAKERATCAIRFQTLCESSLMGQLGFSN